MTFRVPCANRSRRKIPLAIDYFPGAHAPGLNHSRWERRHKQLSAERQIRVIIRVSLEFLTPLLFHKADLAVKARLVRLRHVTATGGMLMMIQFCSRAEDDSIATLAKLQAKVDVIECNLKVTLIESSDL